MHVLHTLDIAHPPLHGGVAERELDDALRMVRGSGNLRGLKIIHGYGKSGSGGVLKDVVLNWAYRNKRWIKSVIPGEQYSVHDRQTLEMRMHAGQISDPDLEAGNPGITIIWVK